MKLLVTTQAVDLDDPILGFMHGWLLAFADRFAEVHVICLREGRHELPPHVHVYSLGKEAGKGRLTYLWRFYRFFWRIYFRVRVEYVFFHMGAIYNFLAAPFFLLRRLFGTRFYWWKAHGHPALKDRLASRFVNRVYTSTESGYPVDTPKRHVIGQAIDTNTFVSVDANDPKRVLYVGRIKPIKHLEVFVAVAKTLIPEGYSFTLVGPIEPGEYGAELVATAEAAGVNYLGSKTQTELVELYQTHGIFLNPSLTHSMDKTVLEAILCGMVPLTANRAFTSLLGKSGLLLAEQTDTEYTKRIRSLTPERCRALQAELATRVRTQHSVATFTERIFG